MNTTKIPAILTVIISTALFLLCVVSTIIYGFEWIAIVGAVMSVIGVGAVALFTKIPE